MSGAALQVAQDALMEGDSVAAVLDIARLMTLDRLMRGLPVAWVGPVESSATVLHSWLAVRNEHGLWAIWRDGRRHSTGAWGAGRSPLLWSTRTVTGRVERAPAVLDGEATRATWGA